MKNVRGEVLDVSNLSRDTKIYRTISVERLLQMFEEKANVVVRPSLWDDTFENLALSSKFELNGKHGDFGFKDDLYGQCWTLHSASDAIWRIYSQGTNGVRIRSTVGKVFDSLAKNSQFGTVGETHIGRVSYLTDRELNHFAETHFLNGNMNGRSVAETLTIKRKAFSHEKEVRLIYQSDNRLNDPIVRYSIDPHSLIDQIMLHPQLKPVDARVLKSGIEQELGFEGEIKRSLLYAPPKGFSFKI